MKIELKDFQEEASEELLSQLRSAKREIAEDNRSQAVILAAPTGSGKTVIAANVIERILNGYDSYPAEPDASFLWLTDQPDLNEQTRRKFLSTSNILGPARLVTIDGSFDQQMFSDGTLYFLNTQKLGKEKILVEKGDERNYTIWETITNTIRRDPTNFYLIIDEAHRGMRTLPAEDEQSRTIVQKFIVGSSGEIEAVPLVVGISATPDRFQAFLQGKPRTGRPVVVDAAKVRESGLIKDFVRFRTPKDDVPSDITLLRDAVKRWQHYESDWNLYCEGQHIQPVQPLMVIQVEDGDERRISRTNLEEVITEIEAVTGPMAPDCYAHAFQNGTSIPVGSSRTLRYLAPADITDDPAVRVVFFKSSLTTGWDCPRAEVMMSFRRASDATLIAQLVGRMVRTPLARRVDSNETLNSVSLVLPHYDAVELARVVERLKADDPDTMPPVQFVSDDSLQDLHRDPEMLGIFPIARNIPTYVLPKRTQMSQVRRLMKLSRALVNDGLDATAIDEAKNLIYDVLDTRLSQEAREPAFQTSVKNMARIQVEERTYEVGRDISAIPEVEWETASDQNLDDRFGAAGRKLGEGLHKDYWRHRTAVIRNAKTAKCETTVLIALDGAVEAVSEAAKGLTNEWLLKYRNAVLSLSDEQKQAYDEIRGASKDPLSAPWDLPEKVEFRKPEESAPLVKHIYIDERGVFEEKLTSWETAVIRDETARIDLVGWLRNLPRKPYSLCIPYKGSDGRMAGLYPDFVVFRQTQHGIVADIVDPHLVSFDDAAAKARGLAEYIDKHPAAFERALIIREKAGTMQRLDAADEKTRAHLLTVLDNNHLRSLYDALTA